LLYPQVQEGHDVLDGVVGQWQGRHAVVRTAAADHGSDQVAGRILGNQWRAHQVGRPPAGGILTMAEAAGLYELFLAPRRRRMLLRESRQGAEVDDVANHGITFMLPQPPGHAA
jgi:hypothetical protein